MQIPFIERVPEQRPLFGIFWNQGFFYFGDEKRMATVTDVKFYKDNRLIVAHRAAAKLYLLDTSEAPYPIIHQIRLGARGRVRKNFFHPDLITLEGNSIYLTSYTRQYAKVTLENDRFKQREIQTIGDDHYHGCAFKNGGLLLGGVESNQITRVNLETGTTSTLDLDEKQPRRIKTIAHEGEDFLLSLDHHEGSSAQPECSGHSWFSHCRQEGQCLVKGDSLLFEDCQIDGAVSRGSLHYLSLHNAQSRCGQIVTVGSEGALKVLKRTPCTSFPHGLDIYDQQLAYSSYSTSSVYIEPLSDFLPIDLEEPPQT